MEGGSVATTCTAQSRSVRAIVKRCVSSNGGWKVNVGYCAPAWSGFCSATDCTRLNSFLRRCNKLGYMEKHYADISTMFQEAVMRCFVPY